LARAFLWHSSVPDKEVVVAACRHYAKDLAGFCCYLEAGVAGMGLRLAAASISGCII